MVLRIVRSRQCDMMQTKLMKCCRCLETKTQCHENIAFVHFLKRVAVAKNSFIFSASMDLVGAGKGHILRRLGDGTGNTNDLHKKMLVKRIKINLFFSKKQTEHSQISNKFKN